MRNYCVLNINIFNCSPVLSAVNKLKTSSSPYQAEWFDKYGVIELHSNLRMSTNKERKTYFLQKKNIIFLKAVF